MKKKITLSTVLFFFGIFSVIAQNAFDDKKRSGTTEQQIELNSFNYPKATQNNIAPVSKTGKKSFQMGQFSPIYTKNYKHETIKYDGKGQVYFVKSSPTKETKQKAAKASIKSVCDTYLKEIAPLLKIQNPEEEFKSVQEHQDVMGNRHIKMRQYHKGFKIFGSEIIVHLSKDNVVSSLNGRNTPTPELVDVVPKLSQEKAFKIAFEALNINRNPNTASKKTLPFGGLKTFSAEHFEEAELVILYDGEVHTLVWHLTVFESFIDRWEYFVDAKNGKVVEKYYGTCTLHYHPTTHKKTNGGTTMEELPPTTATATDLNGVTRQVNTFLQDGTYYMIDTTKPMFDVASSTIPNNPVGAIVTLDLRNERPEEGTSIFYVASTDNSWTDRSAVSAHYNANVSYEYFRTTFNRNSINGQGGSIQSIVNVADPNTGGGYDNAFWNGQFMAYGNGDVAFRPLAGALDVGGHEMSHGVIQNTANLIYQDQSGAMNESFADIFGAMIDRDDWTIGEDVVTNFFPSGAMRDMQNPNNGGVQLGDTGWQPKDMTEFYTGTQNNGGVHINSGICNRAYYLFATEIGRDKAEQIYYKALTDYLTASSQFVDLRIAVIQSATDFHGADSPEVQAAAIAFDTVGITDGAPTDTNDELPPATGDNFILSYDVNDADPNTLYISNTDATGYIPVSQTGIFRKPSVSDDGSLAIFVTEDNTINAVELDRQNPQEFEISDQQLWSSIALSKDGNRLAVVANDESNRIFIIDLVSQTNFEFELFNPTTSSDGISTGDVLYPDALEWDYTGEYLIYDALNGFTNPNGEIIDYWDVGIIKVWDNATNTFGDGSIQKLFTNLPEGVSIGNPSLSKTSNNIIAFDMYDANEDVYSVLTANVETNTLVEVWRHDKLGFPNYSSTDDRLLFDGFNNDGDEVIGVIGLAADKLTPSGDASVLIPDAKWGIWYTEGGRDTSNSSEKEITDFRFNGLNPAVVATIDGTTINAIVPGGTNIGNLVATFTNSVGSSVSVNGTAQQSGITANDFTDPVTYRVTAADNSTKDFLVTVTVENTNDDDNDGVTNDLDQCPNTPLGATVDVTGCEIFSLPASNFSVTSTGESCIDRDNGSITVTAQQNLQYTASLFGGQVNTSQNFTSETTFQNLTGGNYQLCITVVGQTGYEICFNMVVDEPEPLSVASKIDRQGKTVTMQLGGAERYIVTLNETVYTTTGNELTLDLLDQVNTLTVKTDKDCQGIYEEDIVLWDGMRIHPNPVIAEEFYVTFPVDMRSEAQIQIFSMDGSLLTDGTYSTYGNQIMVPAGKLSEGLYMVNVTLGSETATFKIIKQ